MKNWTIKHWAVISALGGLVYLHLKAAPTWTAALEKGAVLELLLQVGTVVAAMVMRSPKDDTHMEALQDANDDLRKRAGTMVGGGAA